MADQPNGIARKTRSDKGVARRTSIDGLCDQFMGLHADQQRVLLDVLEALHRQVVRGSIKPAPSIEEAKEDDNG